MSNGAGSLIGGRYQLIEPVGQGGMGRVWRGRDQLLNRDVAIKEVLLPDQLPASEREELVSRTLLEAQAAARLNHPGIITIYDVVEYDDAPWIIMEFVAGRSLGAEIAARGRLPWGQVAAIGAQVADAIAHAHAAGIVHRDLKPDNVLLAGNRAVVTDFGIARIVDSASHLTRTGTVVGSPRYMAPEQLEGSQAGAPADMWSLGATLYAAVEGATPFEGATLSAVYAGILTRQPPPPQYAGPLADLLTALLTKEPGRRPDAASAARSLAQISSAAASVTPTPTMTVTATPTPMAEPYQRTAEYASPTGATGPTTPVRPPGPGPAYPQPGAGEERRGRPGRRAFVLGGAAVLVAGAGGAYAATRLSGGSSGAVAGAAKATKATRPSGTTTATGTPTSSATESAAPSTASSPVKPSLRYVLTGHTDSVTSVAFRPVASLLASGSADRTVRLWNTRTGAPAGTLTGHTDGITAVAFSPDGALLASGSSDATVRVWNPLTAAPTATLTGHTDQVTAVAFNPKGTLLASSGRDGTIRLWDPGAGTLKGVLGPTTSGGSFAEYRVAFCQQGATLASISEDTLQLWDVASGKLTFTLQPSAALDRLGALACTPDGTTLAVGGAPVQLWNVAKRSATTLVPAPAWITSVAFSPDAAILVCGDHDNTVRLFAVPTGKAITTLTGHTQKVRAVAYSHDGSVFASGSGDNTVRLWTA